MTWVISKPFVQGYTLTIADTCVTYKLEGGEEESYENCLQKIHHIHENYGMLVGFAGDVRNALKIIDNMRIHCEEYFIQNPDGDLELLSFIQDWRNIAIASGKFTFEGDGTVELSVSLTREHKGEPIEGVNGNSQVAIIKSPEYRPMMVHSFQWHAIGSGSYMDVCKGIVKELSDNFIGRIMAINTSPEDFARVIVPNITNILTKELEEKGVGTDLIVGITVPKNFTFGRVYHKDTAKGPDGSPLLPPLFGDFDSLINYLKAKSSSINAVESRLIG